VGNCYPAIPLSKSVVVGISPGVLPSETSWRKSYTRAKIISLVPLDDEELIKKLGELEDKQWANRASAEVRNHMKEYEYQIIYKTEEEGFFSAISEFSSAGYVILPGTTLFKREIFVAIMRRDKVK
jgi:hypothetical protein